AIGLGLPLGAKLGELLIGVRFRRRGSGRLRGRDRARPFLPELHHPLWDVGPLGFGGELRPRDVRPPAPAGLDRRLEALLDHSPQPSVTHGTLLTTMDEAEIVLRRRTAGDRQAHRASGRVVAHEPALRRGSVVGPDGLVYLDAAEAG